MTTLLTPKQVAGQLGISVRMLRDLPIKKVRIGRLVRYSDAAVERYIAKCAGERAA